MSNLWDEFDKSIDTEALRREVASGDGNSFREVPYGDYEVSIEKMELVASKSSGNPMLSVWFKVLSAGEYKGSLIFMNQVVVQPFQVHICDNFLRSLESGLSVEFQSYRQYGNLIMDIHEAISGRLEYGLKYSKNNKGYNTFEITDVFDAE
jgi:hypothetical protein